MKTGGDGEELFPYNQILSYFNAVNHWILIEN
jgi:hypothetical protein